MAHAAGRNWSAMIRGSTLVAAASAIAFVAAAGIAWGDLFGHDVFDMIENGPFIFDLIMTMLWTGLLLVGTIFLARSRFRMRGRWPWAGVVCIGAAALLVVMGAMHSSFGLLWGRTSSGPAPGAFGWLLDLGGWMGGDLLLMLFTGALFVRRLAREFRIPALASVTFFLFLATAVLPARAFLGESTRVAGLWEFRYAADIYVLLMLRLPISAVTALRVGTPAAMSIYWIMVAVLAGRLARQCEFPASNAPLRSRL